MADHLALILGTYSIVLICYHLGRAVTVMPVSDSDLSSFSSLSEFENEPNKQIPAVP